MIRRAPIRYKRNRQLTGPERFGRRVEDAVTGAWTRELKLVTDGYGNRVDPRLPGAWDDPRECLDGNRGPR